MQTKEAKRIQAIIRTITSKNVVNPASMKSCKNAYEKLSGGGKSQVNSAIGGAL